MFEFCEFTIVTMSMVGIAHDFEVFYIFSKHVSKIFSYYFYLLSSYVRIHEK